MLKVIGNCFAWRRLDSRDVSLINPPPLRPFNPLNRCFDSRSGSRIFIVQSTAKIRQGWCCHGSNPAINTGMTSGILLGSIMAIALAAGWLIVGVPYAIILGIGIGILCAVPFLGLVGIRISIGLLFLDQLGVPEAEGMAWSCVSCRQSLLGLVGARAASSAGARHPT